MNRKKVFFYKEYNPNETTLVLLENKNITTFIEDNLSCCELEIVANAIILTSYIYKLNPTNKNDFKTIKKNIINFVKHN